MSLQIELIRAAEFVRVGAEGQFDLAGSKAALAALAAACRKRGVDRALLDLRARDRQPDAEPDCGFGDEASRRDKGDDSFAARARAEGGA